MNPKPLPLPVFLLCATLLGVCTLPSRAQTPAATTTARVIVKYKSDSPLLRREALATGGQRFSGREALAQRLGMSLRAGADVAERTQVLFATGMTSQELAARLARESDVEFAVPDRRRHRIAAPNDPLYLTGTPISGNTGGPEAGQWYLRAPAGIVQSSIDVEPAWSHTIGSPGIVVAVLDTGVRFDHADLLHVAVGGNLLPGYDMISDVDVANDGNGRDADPSDPGDFLTLAEVTQSGGPFEDCGEAAEASSWHGTQTTGIIAALTGNGIGMASVGRNVRVLPVRVLGKCGGFDSDILAGMRWAAGIPVAGVPANPNPARVLNMSLGGEGACDAAYLSAVADVMAAGAVVVAAAGNSAGHAVITPANCPGVIAVAGLRHAGTKVGFSDLGPEIALAAPAGNCVDVGPNDPCRYPILTTANSGTTVPVSHASGGSIYTDAFRPSVGTSFSAPLAAGTAALMLSAQPGLSPSAVRNLMQATARAFPKSGADTGEAGPVQQCTVPQFNDGIPVDQLQCYCTTAACGAGMLDAGAAVIAALGLQAHVGVSPVNPVSGQAVALSAAPSVVTPGRSIVSYLWTIADSGNTVAGFAGGANGPIATVVASGAGTFYVRLTVADNTGLSATVGAPIVVGIGPASTPPATPSAFFENPQTGSFQSGAGLLYGWSCQGPSIAIVIDGGAPIHVPYGSTRPDTAIVCGDGNTNTGFGLLYNYNKLGNGQHSAQLFVNGAPMGSPARFTVTVPAGEFLEGVNKEVTVNDFPSPGRTTILIWQQALQNFAIKSVSP